MNEGLRHIARLLQAINDAFEVAPLTLEQEGDDLVAAGLKITRLKDDGSLFLDLFLETFNELVQRLSPEHEVIYDSQHGLVLARRVTEYVIESFEEEPK